MLMAYVLAAAELYHQQGNCIYCTAWPTKDWHAYLAGCTVLGQCYMLLITTMPSNVVFAVNGKILG